MELCLPPSCLSTGNSGTAWRTGAAAEVWELMSALWAPRSRKLIANDMCVRSVTSHLRSGSKEENRERRSVLHSCPRLKTAICELMLASHLLMMWIFAANKARPDYVMTRILHLATVITLKSTVWNSPDLILICCWVRFDSGATVGSCSLNRPKYVHNFIIVFRHRSQGLKADGLRRSSACWWGSFPRNCLIAYWKYASASKGCAIHFFQCIFAQQLFCAAARSLTPLTVCKDGRSHRDVTHWFVNTCSKAKRLVSNSAPS